MKAQNGGTAHGGKEPGKRKPTRLPSSELEDYGDATEGNHEIDNPSTRPSRTRTLSARGLEYEQYQRTRPYQRSPTKSPKKPATGARKEEKRKALKERTNAFSFTDQPPEPPAKKVKLAAGVGIPAKTASDTSTQRRNTAATAPSQPKGPIAKAKAPAAQNRTAAAPSGLQALTTRPSSGSAEHPTASQNTGATKPADKGHPQHPRFGTPLARILPAAPALPEVERADCIPALNLPYAGAVGTKRVLADVDEEVENEGSEGQREDVGYGGRGDAGYWDGEDVEYGGGEDADYGTGEDPGYGTGEDMNEADDEEREDEDEEEELDEEEEDGGREGPGHRQPRRKRDQGKQAVIKKASAFGRAAPAIQMTCRYVRSAAITKTPMASIEEEEKIIREAWPAVMQLKPFRGQDLPWEEAYYPTLKQYFSTIRGKVVANARTFLSRFFPFQRDRESKRANSKLYKTAIKDDVYTCEDTMSQSGRWCHPLLFEVIQTTFFSTRTSDGFRFGSRFFNPITLELIAIVFTAIRCALDEWAKGVHMKLPFKTSIYGPVYERHLSNLQDLQSRDQEAVKGLCQEIWEQASVSSMDPGPVLSNDQQSKAANDLRERAQRRREAQQRQVTMEEDDTSASEF